MLYATTRSKMDTYTAHRALHDDRSPDGGFFVPFKMPFYDKNQLAELVCNGFSETVSQILSHFFTSRITAWDIDCCIGKTPAKIIPASRRILLAKLWNNPQGDYSYIEGKLYERLCEGKMIEPIANWGKIAIRIAVLFGIYNLLRKAEIESFDVSVISGDFSTPMAVWYAREMGLPVGMIICACNENSAPWDFIHRGELNTGLSKTCSITSELDVPLPENLERLIYGCFGIDEVVRYQEKAQRRGIYQIRPDMQAKLSTGLFVSVVGKDRIEPLINSVYRSNNQILDPYTAVSYGSLQDYRAKTGESCSTVILWDKSPMQFSANVENATKLSKAEIQNYVDSF